jgi:hypothetical protein
MKIYVVLMVLAGSLNVGLAQRTSIKYFTPKDTLRNGETYLRRITVALQPGDSIVKLEARTWSVVAPASKNMIDIKFAAIYMGPTDKESFTRKEVPLEIKLKTLRLDTLVKTKIIYFTTANPAFTRYASDAQLHSQCELYPDVNPKLVSYSGDIKSLLSKSILKGQKGTLVMSFVVDKTGMAGNGKIDRNTFTTITEQDIMNVLSRTKWTPGTRNNKIVNTLYGLIINF